MIGILGGGAWGTALANAIAAGGEDVLIWAREAEVVAAINTAHENSPFLPGITLDHRVRATGQTADLTQCDIWLVVTPAQHLRAVLANSPVAAGVSLILCAKGIEAGSHLLMSEVARAVAPGCPLAVLSGPTFAHEVAAGLPTAVTLACEDQAVGELLAARIARAALRPYLSDDVIGAEIGGAVKNVLAIGCGVVIGAGLGENARAAIIARGFAEMTRFGIARGAHAETMAGLSGLGDLVLTCGSTASRNMSFGVGLGQGRAAAELLANRSNVAEGVFTAPVLAEDAAARGVDMPIAAAVAALISGQSSVSETISALLARPLRTERG